MELQLVALQELADCLAVEIAQVQDTDLALPGGHVLDHVPGFALPDRELIFVRVKLFHHFDETLHREGIMLAADPELLPQVSAFSVLLQKPVVLRHHLAGILNKLCSVIGQSDAFSAAVKKGDAQFLFQFPYRAGQRRLRHKQYFRRLIQ